MGKGFDQARLQKNNGLVLLTGKCAIEETGDFFNAKLGPRLVYRSPSCNDLASTVKALTRLMKVNPLRLVPVNPIRSLGLLVVARLRGSRVRMAL